MIRAVMAPGGGGGCAAVAFCMFPAPVWAHGNLPGGNGFQAGFAHPFVAADHLLCLIALGLLIGPTNSRWPLAAFLAGLAAGTAVVGKFALPVQPLLMGLVLIGGVALMARQAVAPPVLYLGAAFAGALIGFDTDPPAQGGDTVLRLAGSVTAMGLILLNAMALSCVLAGWLGGVPLRVAGSWLIAAAVLVLAFLLRGPLGLT
jgi:urease accessory protein